MLRKLTLFLCLVLLNTSLNAQLVINYSHEGNADTTKLNFAKTEFSKYLKVAIFNSRIVQNDFNIKSTPSFIVNGNLFEGNKNIKEFRQIIDKILSE